MKDKLGPTFGEPASWMCYGGENLPDDADIAFLYQLEQLTMYDKIERENALIKERLAAQGIKGKTAQKFLTPQKEAYRQIPLVHIVCPFLQLDDIGSYETIWDKFLDAADQAAESLVHIKFTKENKRVTVAWRGETRKIIPVKLDA